MKVLSIAILSSAFILSSNTFGQSIEFDKSTVDTYILGSTSVKAMMIMPNGRKHETSVKLQDNVAVNNLSEGNLIYEKEHSLVFQVTGARIDMSGKKYIDVKSTYLFIGTENIKERKMHKTPGM